MLVFGSVEVASQFVGCPPKRRLEAKGGAVGEFSLSSFGFLHSADGINCAGYGNRKAVRFNSDQGEFKNRRRSRSRRGNEAEVLFAPKSASSRRRLPFLNTL